jgi:hypothetical protein
MTFKTDTRALSHRGQSTSAERFIAGDAGTLIQ